jgi:membrane-associated phospholipid phosphatase
MSAWVVISFLYAGYLAVLAWSAPRFVRARIPTLWATAASATLLFFWPASGAATAPAWQTAQVVVPSLAVLVCYWLSGAFFVAPMVRVEQALLRLDRALVHGIVRRYRSAPGTVREVVELAYLFVYAVVPAGAVVLVFGGRVGELDRYWTAVFAAELVCFAVLPWVQTRPPRAVESSFASVERPGWVRRLNLAVLRRGSIQVNTIPSGHAASSTAVAFSVATTMPQAGWPFIILAAGIAVATVLGRYHYVADTVLGVLVGLVAGYAVTTLS